MLLTDEVFKSLMRGELSRCAAHNITLVCEGRRIEAHKNILIRESPYFRCMLSNGRFLESKQDTIELPDIEYAAFQQVIRFFYTASIDVNLSNLEALLQIMDLHQISSLRLCISIFIGSSMDEENCFLFHVLSKRYNLEEIAEKALLFCRKKFPAVFQIGYVNNDLMAFEPDSFIKLISSPFLCVRVENQLLMIILKWCAYAGRAIHLPELLQHVRLHRLTEQETRTMSTQTVWPSAFKTRLSRMLKNRGVVQTLASDIYPPRYSDERVVILAIGGSGNEVCYRSMTCYTQGMTAWSRSIPKRVRRFDLIEGSRVMPLMSSARMNAAVAQDRYRTFIIGGTDSETSLCTGEEYRAKENAWFPLPDLPYPMEGAVATFCNNTIYLAGGISSSELWALDFGLRHPTWRLQSHLSEKRHCHSMVAGHGFVYILGGWMGDPEAITNSVIRYDVVNDVWIRLASMIEPRAMFGAAFYENHIYVMGGIGSEQYPLRSVEQYDILTNTWVSQSDMPSSRCNFGVALCEDHIYCIGGESSLRQLNTVDSLNPVTCHWETLTSMQEARVCLCAASVYIPLHFNEEAQTRSQLCLSV